MSDQSPPPTPEQSRPPVPPQPPLPPVPPSPPATLPPEQPAVAELRALVAPAGWRLTALLAASVVGVGLVMAVIAYLAVGLRQGDGSIEIASPLGWIALLWVALLGGGVAASAGAETSGQFVTAASADLSLIAVGVFATIAALAVLLTRLLGERRPPRPWWALLMRSAAEAVMVSVVVTVLAAVVRVGGESTNAFFTASFTITAHPFRVFALVFVTLTLATLGARLRSVRPSRGLSIFLFHLREAGTYAGVLLGLFSLAMLVAFIVGAIRADAPEAFLLWAPLGVNAAALALGMAQFGAVRVSALMAEPRTYHLWDLTGTWSIAIIVVTVLVLAFLCVFLGARRVRTGRVEVVRVWPLPVIVLGVSLVMYLLLLMIRVTANLFAVGGDILITPTWETPFLIAVFALLVSLGAEVAPGVLHGAGPALFGVLAGRRAAARWVAGPTAAPLPGKEAMDAAASVPAASTPTPPVFSRAARRGVIIGGSAIVGLGVLIAAGFGAVAVVNGQNGPDAPVRAYLDEIADGRADAASRLLDPGIRNDERTLLTDAAFADAAQRIVVSDVRTTEKADGRATVTATFSLDGEAFTRDFSVVSGPKKWLVLDTWKLAGDPLLVPVTVSGDVPDVTVGTTKIEMPGGEETLAYPSVQVYAYPGIYRVTIGGTGTFFDATGGGDLRVVPDGYATVQASLTPTSALKDAVLAKVEERAKACVTVPTNMDDACPYAVRQDDLAAMKLLSAPSGFSEFDASSFSTQYDGSVSVTEEPTDWNPDPDAREYEFGLQGTYTVDGDTVTVSFSDSWW